MIPFHDFANAFPLLEGAERAEFDADIAKNGVRQKIDIWEGAILDGRNRYQAALACGLIDRDMVAEDRPTLFRAFLPGLDGDPLAYVISQNLKRRHMDESQRAMAAARIANMRQGGQPTEPANLPVRQSDAAARLNVSERLVRDAKTVLTRAEPEIQHAVDQGKLAVSAAAKATSLAPETQRKIAAEAEAGHANAVRTVIKQETRAVRERTTGLKAPEGLFGVIVEDFEWDFEVRSRETGMDRHAGNHYETADDAHTAEEIVERTRERFLCAAPDCVLWQWTTGPHLAIALDVMKLRGFKYVSNYVWNKDRIITGWWSRFKHEHLLIGTKGNVPCPAPGTQWDSVIDAALGEHSAKPEAFLEMIEQYFPTWRKIELNRRGPARPGWAAWGNQAEPELPPHNPETGEILEIVEGPVGGSMANAAELLDIPGFLQRSEEEAA
jgi:N6-adenosine-specific RNA methylase IME4